jgi:hypothetical protein
MTIQKHQPTELVKVSPEVLAIANSYIEHGSVEGVVKDTGLTSFEVTQYLARDDVRSYLDRMYLDAGYRNRDKLASVMDSIIEKKLLEMQENEISSSKDIVDILQVMHKIKMEEMAMMLKVGAVQAPSKQVNVQINESPYSGHYGNLIGELLK